jgi:diguanylate cyclase (GGDEF)-like protein/PAS domain S-box-containing protein
MRKVPLFDDNGVATHLLVITDDVTDRVAAEGKLAQSEARLQASEHRLRTIADTMPAAIAYVDRQQIYRFTNTAFERLFGLTPEQVRGRTIRDVVGEAGHQFVEMYLKRAFGGERVTFEREQSLVNGVRWIEATYIPEIDDSNNEVVGVHAMLLDITAQKIEAQRLLRLSQVDGLTGLANRVGFEQRLSDAMAQTRTTGQALAVMYFDIDHFKQINDTHGHAAGDALLLAFAQRLRSSLRKTDTVARLGGDEFVVVMERVLDPKIAARLAAQALEEILRPFALDNHSAPLTITTSIGIAFFDGGATTAEQLVAEADAMLYAAKRKGRNNVCIAPWPHQARTSEAQLH